jgi:MYXO-CTERM domain-containing protein
MRRLLLIVLTLLLPTAALAGGDPPEDQKFALAVFHFNVQYVAGGLEGFVQEFGLADAWDGLDYTEAGVEDAIIVESLLPLLELFAAHPTWGADFEMQGYMVDRIRQRHPEVLALMQDLDGQVSFDSFHYSDELWTAQPAQAIARSRLETQAAFLQAGLTLGDATFTQEGQFSMGMDAVLPLGHTAMLPRNLFRLHYPDEDRRPLFEQGDIGVIVAGHGWTEPESGMEVRWTFMDDGELLATNDLNPYFLPSFTHDPESVAEYEAELVALEDEGFNIATVAEAVGALRATGFEPEPLPTIVDGAWQPNDTGNLSRWMGDFGLGPDHEADGDVRTAWHFAYAQVRLADLLGAEDPTTAWRELLLAGVSDSTGWNPIAGEVQYAFTHTDAASALALPVLQALVEPCDECQVRFDGATGDFEVVEAGTITIEDASAALDGVVASAESPAIEVQTHWFTHSLRPDATGLAVVFTGLDGADTWDRQLAIPFTQDTIRWIPAGRTTGWESLPLSVFADDDPMGIPLANGLFDLGEGLFLVLAPGAMNLAARVHPDQDTVVFRDRTALRTELQDDGILGQADEQTWELYFVEGEAAAEALAIELVQSPDLWVVPPGLDDGCACQSSLAPAGGPAGLLLVLAGLAIRRRRS